MNLAKFLLYECKDSWWNSGGYRKSLCNLNDPWKEDPKPVLESLCRLWPIVAYVGVQSVQKTPTSPPPFRGYNFHIMSIFSSPIRFFAQRSTLASLEAMATSSHHNTRDGCSWGCSEVGSIFIAKYNSNIKLHV